MYIYHVADLGVSGLDRKTGIIYRRQIPEDISRLPSTLTHVLSTPPFIHLAMQTLFSSSEGCEVGPLH